ncbi:MAG TPA: DUF222 domain-containing protein [Intrasporangium sp.]|uniref:DUF222 domain-containing protein n=1 Tax=Intrasporangium sp. TaxID=1925024 RepID=UPI002D79C08B|nr:DUF222 domain-containing protein [Intrasporangium sp.]HET7397962.1 DUF222 domain-containing protein [Intrasporangium sp.]
MAVAACVRAEEQALADEEEGAAPGRGVVGHRPSAEQVVASSLAPLLRVSPRALGARVARAVRLVEEMPGTLAAGLAGVLEPARVSVIVDQAGLLEPGAAPVFDRVLHEDPGLPELVPARLRRVRERVAALVDAGAVERRAQAAREDRFLRVQPGTEPGMAWWSASLPAADSARAWAAVDHLAGEYVRADPGRLIEQARADTFLDLVLAQASVRTTVELVVPIATRRHDCPVAAPAAAIPAQPVPGAAAVEATGASATGGPAALRRGESRRSVGGRGRGRAVAGVRCPAPRRAWDQPAGLAAPHRRGARPARRLDPVGHGRAVPHRSRHRAAGHPRRRPDRRHRGP